MIPLDRVRELSEGLADVESAAEVAALRAAARGVLTALEWYDEDDDASAADAEAACQELDALLVLTAPAATTGGA